MKRVLFALAIATLPLTSVAQNIAGSYDVRVNGTNHYLDISPAQKSISGNTTMIITQTGEKISVEFGSFAGAMAATRFKGKVGNNQFAAVWWYQGSPDETKVLLGQIKNPQTLIGKLIYPRVAYRDEGAPGTKRFVPGWVEINFSARKKTQPPPPSSRLKEDCIRFDYRQAKVQKINERWKIMVANMSLKDFGDNADEARQALKVLQKYRMNAQCFVGRPDPSMEYYLVADRAPSGAMKGEDCLGFDPAKVQAKKVEGSWKIVENSHWVLDFDQNAGEARQALRIIKKYRFGNQCFIGRPGPAMTYFR